MIYLLDTDQVSLSQRGHPLVNARIQAAGPSQIAISVITVEEQLRGWLAAMRLTTQSYIQPCAFRYAALVTWVLVKDMRSVNSVHERFGLTRRPLGRCV